MILPATRWSRRVACTNASSGTRSLPHPFSTTGASRYRSQSTSASAATRRAWRTSAGVPAVTDAAMPSRRAATSMYAHVGTSASAEQKTATSAPSYADQLVALRPCRNSRSRSTSPRYRCGARSKATGSGGASAARSSVSMALSATRFTIRPSSLRGAISMGGSGLDVGSEVDSAQALDLTPRPGVGRGGPPRRRFRPRRRPPPRWWGGRG